MVIEEFRKYQSNIEGTAISLFLTIALENKDKGIPMESLSKKLNIAQSSVSRNVTKFLKLERNINTKIDFLEASEDPYNRTRKLVRLSTKGKVFIKQLQSKLL